MQKEERAGGPAATCERASGGVEGVGGSPTHSPTRRSLAQPKQKHACVRCGT